jgi:hypothetical protein
MKEFDVKFVPHFWLILNILVEKVRSWRFLTTLSFKWVVAYIYQSSRLTLFQKCFCCHLHWNSEEYDQLLKSPELTTIQKTSYSLLFLVLRFWVSILTLSNLLMLNNFCHWKQSILGKSEFTFDIGKCSMSRIFWRWF